MAIGMLFLGGGRATLCTSKEAIGALVISLYPRFPISTSDCRYHLQAFRHLYVLAVEYRCLETMDVDTNQVCTVPVEITLKPSPEYSEHTVRVMTPCILPELKAVKSVRVCSDRYWGVTWHMSTDDRLAKSVRRGCVLTVQRKTGHLSYSEDPLGLRNLHARALPLVGSSLKSSSSADFIQSFSGDPAVLAFAQHIADTSQHIADDDAQSSGSYMQVMFQSLKLEKPEAIPIYAELLTITQKTLARYGNWATVTDVRMILSYYGLLSPR